MGVGSCHLRSSMPCSTRSPYVFFFLKIGLDVHEARALFQAVDSDGSGTADRDEFLFGVMRMKEGLKALDMMILISDVHKLGHMVEEMCESLKTVARDVNGVRVQMKSKWKPLSVFAPARLQVAAQVSAYRRESRSTDTEGD
mmetsp:Transcript_10898/g.24062  ORF Transcript_10898/g.24062 Transcript_10898/m.24062 type:complete len:142 (-) Transcript_10898:126-551(-)